MWHTKKVLKRFFLFIWLGDKKLCRSMLCAVPILTRPFIKRIVHDTQIKIKALFHMRLIHSLIFPHLSQYCNSSAHLVCTHLFIIYCKNCNSLLCTIHKSDFSQQSRDSDSAHVCPINPQATHNTRMPTSNQSQLTHYKHCAKCESALL